MESLYPAPWTLTGRGYILLYRFQKHFVEEKGNVPLFLKNSFKGGLGAIMLVDYNVSDAGPYSELLFIPGKFLHGGKKLSNISKIYVSTMASVENGIVNWGIPKEEASFTFNSLSPNTEQIRITKGNAPVAEFTLQSSKLTFPVNTKLLPFPLVQECREKYYYTTFRGSGKGKLAKLKNVQIHPSLFPDVSSFKPLIAVKVEPFKITFPVATIEPSGL